MFDENKLYWACLWTHTRNLTGFCFISMNLHTNMGIQHGSSPPQAHWFCQYWSCVCRRTMWQSSPSVLSIPLEIQSLNEESIFRTGNLVTEIRCVNLVITSISPRRTLITIYYIPPSLHDIDYRVWMDLDLKCNLTVKLIQAIYKG